MTTPESATVVVVGAGLAGLVTATRLLDHGVRPVVVEAGEGDDYACNSRYAGGVLHLAHHDVRGDLADVTGLMTGGGDGVDVRADLVADAVADAPRAVEWLMSKGVTLAAMSDVAWQGTAFQPPGLSGPRWDWRGCGTDPTLRLLAGRLRQAGVRWLSGHRAGAVARAVDGTVAGIAVEDSGGRRGTVAASMVVLADGGFGADRTLVREHIAPHVDAVARRAAASATGTAIRAGLELGAATTQLSPFYGHLLSRGVLLSEEMSPYPQLDVLAREGLLVDRSGHRVGHAGFTGVRLANELAHGADPAGAVAVFDERIWRTEASTGPLAPNPLLVELGHPLHRADDLDTLASLSGLPAESLCTAVHVRDQERAAGGKAPLTAPFYAAPAAPGITHTMGGLRIDRHCRVERGNGCALPGIYAVGAAAGGYEGGVDARYLGGLVKAVVSGRAAADHAAHQVRRPS